jgi:cytochrome b
VTEARTEAAVSARLWDWPVRLVHWALVLLLGFAWWSVDDHLTWHRWSGYAILGLLLFRVLWGFVGSRTARFSSFVKGPGATIAYARTLPNRDPADVPGHNPIGGWSVVALLVVLLATVTTGLFAVDVDAFEAGPLSDRVSYDLGRQFAVWHDLIFRILQVLVAVHVLAVAYYLVWKRTNLIGAMFTGRRRFAADPGLTFAPAWRIAAAAVLAAAIAWIVSKGFRL